MSLPPNTDPQDGLNAQAAPRPNYQSRLHAKPISGPPLPAAKPAMIADAGHDIPPRPPERPMLTDEDIYVLPKEKPGAAGQTLPPLPRDRVAPADTAPLPVTGMADAAAPQSEDVMAEAIKTMHHLGHQKMSEDKLRKVLQRGAKEYVNLLRENDARLSPEELKRRVAELSPAKLAQIGQMGAARTAYMDTLANLQVPENMSVKDVLKEAHGRANTGQGVLSDHAYQIAAQLDRIAVRTGMGPEWQDKMIDKMDHVASRLAKSGIDADPAKGAIGVAGQFDKAVTDTAAGVKARPLPRPPVAP